MINQMDGKRVLLLSTFSLDDTYLSKIEEIIQSENGKVFYFNIHDGFEMTKATNDELFAIIKQVILNFKPTAILRFVKTMSEIKLLQKLSSTELFSKIKILGIPLRSMATVKENEKLKSFVDQLGILTLPAKKKFLRYKKINFQILRDGVGNQIVVGTSEGVDPYTKEKIEISPAQSITGKEYQKMRDQAFKIVSSLEIVGNCLIQFVLDEDHDQYYLSHIDLDINDTSLLIAKCSNYPIDEIAIKTLLGFTLSEIKISTMDDLPAIFEPVVDHFAISGSFIEAQNPAIVMGRTAEEVFQKIFWKIEDNALFDKLRKITDEQLEENLINTSSRFCYIIEAFDRGYKVSEINELTHIDFYFLNIIEHITKLKNELVTGEITKEKLKTAKRYGFSDRKLSEIWDKSIDEIRSIRKKEKIIPIYKQVDPYSAEYNSDSQCYYETYDEENENQPIQNKSMLIINPQSVEDIKELNDEEYQIIVVSDNLADNLKNCDLISKVYYAPVTSETILNIIDSESNVRLIYKNKAELDDLINYLDENNIKPLVISSIK